MILALVVFVVVIALTVLFIKMNNTKLFLTSLIAICMLTTVGICIQKPIMHKNFSISIIDYLIKFDTDGSITTTKETTTTTIKEDKE